MFAVTLAANQALAFNAMPHNAGYDSTVTFNKSYLTAQFSMAFNKDDELSNEPTQITTWVWTSNSTQDNSGKEINVYDTDYSPSTWYGVWQCRIYDGASCLDAKVQMNQRYVYTDTQARSLMCEEIGHGVSLDHLDWDYASCMKRPTCWDCMLLHSHDWTHIDFKY
jgi:hypothetical protein